MGVYMSTQTAMYVLFGSLACWGVVLILQEIHAGMSKARRQDAVNHDEEDSCTWQEGDGEEWKRR